MEQELVPTNGCSQIDSGKPILERQCTVQPDDGGEPAPLFVRVLRPQPTEHGEVTATMAFSCRYFERSVTGTFGDDLQAITGLFGMARAWLETQAEIGFSIYWRTPGDLELYDFWTGEAEPSPITLATAATRAVLEREAERPPALLRPQQRVAVDDDGDAITLCAINDDGAETIDGLIDANAMAGLTPDELCEHLGRMLLSRTPVGRRWLEG